jgi:hypothetical protein
MKTDYLPIQRYCFIHFSIVLVTSKAQKLQRHLSCFNGCLLSPCFACINDFNPIIERFSALNSKAINIGSRFIDIHSIDRNTEQQKNNQLLKDLQGLSLCLRLQFFRQILQPQRILPRYLKKA